MAVYKFRLTFEDHDDVSRDIEIKPTQTFLEFHNIIQKAIGFDGSKSASFFMSQDNWRKGQEITLENPQGEAKLMANAKLNQMVVDPHQKIYYCFDGEKWCFYIELIKIVKDEGGEYPRIVKSSGVAPKQNGIIQLSSTAEDLDFLNEQIFVEGEEPEGEEGEEKIAGHDDEEESMGEFGDGAEDSSYGQEEY